MTRDVIVVPPELSLRSAWLIMRRERIRHLPVAREGVLVGLLSERDVLVRARLGGDGEIDVPQALVGVAMSACSVVCDPPTSVSELVRLMTEGNLDAIPVAKNGRIVGLVTSTDLMRVLAENPSSLSEPLLLAFRIIEAAA